MKLEVRSYEVRSPSRTSIIPCLFEEKCFNLEFPLSCSMDYGMHTLNGLMIFD